MPTLALLPLLLIAPQTPAGARPPSVAVTVDSSAHTVTLTAGSFMIEAGGAHADHGGHGDGEPLMRFRWPVDGWMRGVRLTIHDGEGRPLDRRLVHHINVVNFDRRQLFYEAPERILALGQETEDIVLPRSVGVPVEAGSAMAIVLMWHNSSPTMHHGVTVTLTIEWSPTNLYPAPVSVLPVYMNVADPVASPVDFDLPPGPQAFSADFTMPINGRILGVGGHLHDHGVGLSLAELRADGPRTTVELGVERSTDGQMLKVERKYPGIRGRGIKLVAGHRYRMTGRYDNPTGATIPGGAMVHLVLLLAPDVPAAWPAVDPEAADFRRDVAWLEGERHPGEGRR